MKKIIAILFLIFVSVVVSYSQTYDRVKVEVRGFTDQPQAELKISQYLKQNATWAKLVDASPDIIMLVTVRMDEGETWTQVDRRARAQNNALRSADQAISSLLWGSYSRSRTAYTIKQTVANLGRGQLQGMVKPEYYEYRTSKASCTIEMIDARSKAVMSRAIGANTVTLKGLRSYDQRPFIVLEEGDLSTVGIDGSMNLYGTYKQLLQLSAFVNANLPENQIIGK